MIKDITYCSNMNCKRNCERRMNNKDFRNERFSISNFDCNVKDFDENKCEYYLKEENVHN